MATYQELFDLRNDTTLRNKIAVAVAIKAQTLIDGETPSAEQIAWANSAISNPLNTAGRIINYVLAANKTANVSAINGASDALIQGHVDSAVDALIAGGITS